VDESAGRTKLLGSGLGPVRLQTILATIPGLFELVAGGKTHFDVEQVPMADVEAAWNRVEEGPRFVFTVEGSIGEECGPIAVTGNTLVGSRCLRQ
jgi:hypothetical protein